MIGSCVWWRGELHKGHIRHTHVLLYSTTTFCDSFSFCGATTECGKRERQRIENTCERRKRERIGERKDGEHCLFLSTKKYIMKYRLLDSLFDAERDADAKQSKTRR